MRLLFNAILFCSLVLFIFPITSFAQTTKSNEITCIDDNCNGICDVNETVGYDANACSASCEDANDNNVCDSNEKWIDDKYMTFSTPVGVATIDPGCKGCQEGDDKKRINLSLLEERRKHIKFQLLEKEEISNIPNR